MADLQSIISWVHQSLTDQGSPIGVSKDLFVNLIAASIGALASAVLIAPMTAYWVRRGDQKKWEIARLYYLQKQQSNARDIFRAVVDYYNAFYRAVECRVGDDEVDEIAYWKREIREPFEDVSKGIFVLGKESAKKILSKRLSSVESSFEKIGFHLEKFEREHDASGDVLSPQARSIFASLRWELERKIERLLVPGILPSPQNLDEWTRISARSEKSRLQFESSHNAFFGRGKFFEFEKYYADFDMNGFLDIGVLLKGFWEILRIENLNRQSEKSFVKSHLSAWIPDVPFYSHWVEKTYREKLLTNEPAAIVRFWRSRKENSTYPAGLESFSGAAFVGKAVQYYKWRAAKDVLSPLFPPGPWDLTE